MRPALRLLRALVVSSLLWMSQGALSTGAMPAESAVWADADGRGMREGVRARALPVADRPESAALDCGLEASDGERPLHLPAAWRAARRRLHLLHCVLLI